MELGWLLPESVSTFGPDIDRLYYIVLWITGIVFFLTEGLLVYFVIRYRHKEGRKAEYLHGNSKLEVVWTTATTVIVVGLGIASTGVWHDIKRDVPDGAMEVIVTARQFEWNVTYPGADGALGTSDDFVRRNALHVQNARPVVVHLRSEDVIHSFFLPELRVKQDALPGKTIRVWFEATAPGTYTIGCAELCGLGHYRMAGEMTVLTAADYQSWLQTQLAQEEQ
jgi:cytochrome c oxidase subunit 2